MTGATKEAKMMHTIPAKRAGDYRLIHTADWHLGKRLNDQSRDEEHARFLKWLLRVVRECDVDAIILAGDVFDSANPPQSALTRYFDFVSGLFRTGGCQLVVIGGNHDSAAQLEAPKQPLRALHTHIAGALAEDPAERILCLPDEGNPQVAVALVPFLRDRDLRVGKAGESAEEIRSQVVAGIRKRYEETAAATEGLGCPVIATGHLTVVGAKSSDSEREIHIGGLGAFSANDFPERFCYVGLGHLHRPQAAGGQARVRYAGSPIPLSFSEAGDRKELRVLDVSGQGVVQHALPVPVYRRLARIRTTSAGLEGDLDGFDPDPGELRTWVEVVVEDSTLEDDLNERVRCVVEKAAFDVLKVLRGRSAEFAGMTTDEVSDDEAIETLLDRPSGVFEHLLAQCEDLDEADKEELKTAFSVLVDLDSQPEPADAR